MPFRSTSLSLTTNRYNLFSNEVVPVPVVAVAVPDVVSVVTITADNFNVVMLLLLFLMLLLLLLIYPLLRLFLVMLNISDNILNKLSRLNSMENP